MKTKLFGWLILTLLLCVFSETLALAFPEHYDEPKSESELRTVFSFWGHTRFITGLMVVRSVLQSESGWQKSIFDLAVAIQWGICLLLSILSVQNWFTLLLSLN